MSKRVIRSRSFAAIGASLGALGSCAAPGPHGSSAQSQAAPGALAGSRAEALNRAYVEAWLSGDPAAVMALLEDDARIAPSGLAPIKGRSAIRDFWFPTDGSATTIHGFSSEVVWAAEDGDLLMSAQRTHLDWSMTNGSSRIAREQWGLATTIYRRQKDDTYKIWRQAWTDVAARDK